MVSGCVKVERKNYTVYIHKCLENGRAYVGVTSLLPEKRWANGRGYKKNRYFWSAIQKHGWDGFEHIIYKTGLSAKAAYKLECKLIAELETHNPEYGYNLSTGGEQAARGINRFGERHPRSIAVYSPELDEEFGSMSLAAQFTSTSTTSIRRCINGEIPYAGTSPFTTLPVSWRLKIKI